MVTPIEAAAEAIGAVVISVGWAHHDDNTRRWYVVSDADMAALAAKMVGGKLPGDAYSHWCAESSAKEMPAGWAPEG